MDGIHDLGGKHGYGKVNREPNEPVFHARWEARVFAMVSAGFLSGAWNNADRFRHGIERIDPVAYLSHGYYGRWLGGIETLFVEAGIIQAEELTQRALAFGAHEHDRIAARPLESPDPVSDVERRATAQRQVDVEPAFAIGEHVFTSTEVKSGHTRLPAYARGKRGTVLLHHGAWAYPDTNAHGLGEQPRHLYTIQFEGQELWGPASDPTVKVSLDLFEPYLQRAPR